MNEPHFPSPAPSRAGHPDTDDTALFKKKSRKSNQRESSSHSGGTPLAACEAPKKYQKKIPRRPISPLPEAERPISETNAHAIDTPDPDQTALQPGIKPVLELLERAPSRIDAVFLKKTRGRNRRGTETDRILDLCRAGGVRFSLVDDDFLHRLWPGRHQGVIARLYPAGFTDLPSALEAARNAPLPLLLALDQVQDPGNAGALARTLYALGGAGIILPRHNGVYLGGAAAKVSAGALEHLAIVKAANLGQALDAACEAGFTVYGASSRRDEALPPTNAFRFSPEFPAVLVLGSEESGLRPGIAKRCSRLLHIPLTGAFDSLGVAQAGAILMGLFAASQPKNQEP